MTVLASQPLTAAQFPSSGAITFAAAGPSQRLFLNGVLVVATDTSFTAGSVGIWGSAGTGFANFSANAINLQNATLPFTDNFAATADGQLSTFWTDQAGDFTVQANQAVASSAASNVATVNGASTAAVTESLSVASLSAGQFAALVARYQANGTMYFAGVRDTGGVFTAEIWKMGLGGPTRLNFATLNSFAGGKFSFKLSGSSLQLIVGSTTVSATDSSITAAGLFGIDATAGTQVSGFGAQP
jgi:hypothetical protein